MEEISAVNWLDYDVQIISVTGHQSELFTRDASCTDPILCIGIVRYWPKSLDRISEGKKV